MADKLRLFVALELPQAAARRWRRSATPPTRRCGAPVPDEALHVTLAFLGWRAPHDAETVAALLPACAGLGPPLALGEPLLLPPRRARVLCAEVQDAGGELAALQARVAARWPGRASTAGDGGRSGRTRPSRGCAPAPAAPPAPDRGPESARLRGRAAHAVPLPARARAARCYEPLVRVALPS